MMFCSLLLNKLYKWKPVLYRTIKNCVHKKTAVKLYKPIVQTHCECHTI